MSLAGKCAVVYSGARGIGRAYCEHLLKNGCKVYFGDILVEEGSQTALELGRKYKDSTVVFLKCNVLVETEVKELLTRAITDCENVDIVVANTGTVNEIELGKVYANQLRKCHESILYYYGTHEQDQWRKRRDKTRMGVPVYTATKHAITGFVRAWGTEFNYKLTNTRINCICPSGVGTKLLFGLKPEQFFLKEHNEHVVEWKHKTDQLLSSDDIGESLIALLLDTEANGQCLRVEKDGRFYAKFSEEVM